jgi:glycosyltransferase involved in cell wall biosynthesis
VIVGVDARELVGQPTGTGRYLRNLLSHWSEAAHSGRHRIVAYFNGTRPADGVLDRPGIVCRSPNTRPVHGLVWQERVLPSAARSDGLTVFFSPAYSCPLRLDAPRVTAVHDLSFFSMPQDFRFTEALRRRLFTARSIRVSRRILACSRFTAREIADRFPEAADRTRTILLAAEEGAAPAPDRHAARAALGATGPYLITVGSVFNRRRLPELTFAASRLARRWPGLVLDVVGDNRTYPRLDLRSLADRSGLGPRLRVSGFVTEADLRLRYAAADLAVFLSDYEGFGLPALEAAAHGVPLLVSRRPSLGEVFADAARLVDGTDADAVAAEAGRILEDPEAAASLRGRGLSLARRLSWASTARETWAALEEAARA